MHGRSLPENKTKKALGRAGYGADWAEPAFEPAEPRSRSVSNGGINQKESELTTSPPLRVPSAHQAGRLTVSLMYLTEPSAKHMLTPPE